MALSNNLIRSALVALVALSALPAFAQPPRIPDYALQAWDEAKGLAVQPAFEWAKKQHMLCDKTGGGTERCTVASRTESVHVFSPDPDLAVVEIFYNPSTGNRGPFAALLLGRRKTGEFRVLREMKNVPNVIRTVTFEGTRLVLDVEVMKRDDPGCCPTGRARYAYDLRTEAVDYLWGDRPER